MINVLRKNQKALWIVIALLCIPFIFYFQNDVLTRGSDGQTAEVYGKPVGVVDFQHNGRLFGLARDLGMFTFLQDMVAGARSESEAFVEFTFNRLVLHHEAERLGLKPSTEQILNVVRGLRAFQGEKGVFDPKKFDEFTQVLPSMGFTEGQIEELAGDQIILQQLKDLVGTGIQVPESETREDYDRAYGKVSAAVVRLRSEQFAQGIQPNDEEIGKYFEANAARLTTEEKRKVIFVSFALNEEQKKLTGRERVDLLQKVADRANDFSQALLEEGAQFEPVAAKFEAPLQTTGDFTKTSPDPLLNVNPQLTATAFQLSPNEPNSDAVQAGDGFYILHLAGIEPARPLSLEEAKPKIVEAIKQERVREILAAKAAEAAGKIREALKNGTPFDGALNAAAMPFEKIPPFGLADQPKMKPAEPGKPPEPESQPEDMNQIKGAVAELGPNEVSEFVPTTTGGLIAVVEKREPADNTAYEAVKGMFNQRVVRAKRDVAFYDWLHERRREAGVPETVEPNEPKAG